MKIPVLIPLLVWCCCCRLCGGQTDGSCKGRPLDLVFVIDSSRSVRPEDYEKIKSFIKQVLLFLNMGQNQTRVGLVQFGSVVHNEFFLDAHFEKQQMLRAVENMQHLASGTMTGLALQFMRREAFSEERGARPAILQVQRVAVVVTDGRPQDSVQEEAALARQDGIQIFAVGVGRVDMATLRAIGSQPHEEHVHLVANFSQIEKLISVLSSKLCADRLSVSHQCNCGKMKLFHNTSTEALLRISQQIETVMKRIELLEKGHERA